MKTGDKITVEDGVVLIAKLQESHLICKGCYFRNFDECLAFNIEKSIRPKCTGENGESLIFKRS